MKLIYTLFTVALLFTGLQSSAQEVDRDRPTNKDGKQILPETGDFALGIQGTDFLRYAGNFFSKTSTNEAPSFSSVNNSFYLKRFIANDKVLRLSFDVNAIGINNIYANVKDDQNENNILDLKEVTDVHKSSSYSNGIGMALEKRRGYGRLQGFYGAGVSFTFGGTDEVFTYGNLMAATNLTPTSFNGSNSTRTLESGSSFFGLGAMGFIGVEYFVARKISLQGEIGWGLNYNWNSAINVLYETMLGEDRVEYSKISDIKSRTIKYNNKPSSAIGIMFHF